MKSLIVDNNFTNRVVLQELLKDFGPTHIAVDGSEAVKAACDAIDGGEPYDLICLDIMMPGMDGQAALRAIRDYEHLKGVSTGQGSKIMMTSALDDSKNVIQAFHEECDAYLVKPIGKERLRSTLIELELL